MLMAVTHTPRHLEIGGYLQATNGKGVVHDVPKISSDTSHFPGSGRNHLLRQNYGYYYYYYK